MEVTLYSDGRVGDILYVRGYEYDELEEEEVRQYIKKYIEGVDLINYATVEDKVLRMLLKVDSNMCKVVSEDVKKSLKTIIKEFFLG